MPTQQVAPSATQYHLSQLDGSVGRGLVTFMSAREITGVYLKSALSTNWTVEIGVMTDTGVVFFPWLSHSAKTYAVDLTQFKLPPQSQIRVTTPVLTNSAPTAIVVSRQIAWS